MRRTSASIRERLLARCDVLYAEARGKDRGSFRPDPSKLVAAGIQAARGAIEGAPLDEDAARYVAGLKARIEALKEAARADPDDEDGWALGGLTTVLREVEGEGGGQDRS